MRFRTVSLSLPLVDRQTIVESLHTPFYRLVSLSRKIKDLIGSVLQFLQGLLNKTTRINQNFSSSDNFFQRKLGFLARARKYLRILLIIGIAGLLLVGVLRILTRLSNFSAGKVVDGQVQVKGAKATQDINKEFTFPLTDDKDKEIAKIKYMIEKAELRDEIIVQGRKATAVEGRTFLVITLKITNEYKLPIKINTRDYLRLSVNGNKDEWLAPDIHNDPVEVQAISTKPTRVGFPISETDTNLVLSVGEIDKDKEEIPIEF